MISRITTALKSRRNELDGNEKGFTLIELLVVVIIIGILAAIAIPVYMGIQNNAKDSAATSDAVNAKVAVIAYQTNQQTLPATGADLTGSDAAGVSYGFEKSDGVGAVAYTTDGSSKFCIQVTSATDKTFGITESSGAQAGTCGAGGVFTAAS